jgi:type II secretory pathway component PulJ
MISLAIVAAIVSMVYGSYAATARSMDRYQARVTASNRAQFLLRLMVTQLRSAYLPHDPNEKDAQTMPLGNPASQRGVSTVFRGNADDPRGDVLSFVTTNQTGRTQGAGGLSLVRYSYVRSERALFLLRSAAPDDPVADTGSPVLATVAGLELRFHDGRRWHERWDSDARNGLPRAVRITLTVSDRTGRQQQYIAAAPVLCQAESDRKR